ncbi:hypothetical protein OUZ56_033637 [Daphnia magna]|uniref:Uncharacterized protein n=1 Tax=Daphnia magna TaxID=35525 RepID=A0ABR0BAY4_9CRUS|nr:hypothetical protein OUZ56_033637 [Daphnia magna]
MAVTRYLATTNQRKNQGYDDTIWHSLLLLLRKPKYKIKQKQGFLGTPTRHRRDLNAVRQNMMTTPGRVQVPGLNLQQQIGSSIRYTSATCLTHSVATPSHIDSPYQNLLVKLQDLCGVKFGIWFRNLTSY